MSKQSILGRIAQLAKANINALLDQAEDPQKMLDQMVRDYTNSIADAEAAIAQTIGNLRMQEQDYQEDVRAAELRMDDARTVVASPAVAAAIPLSLGDSYAGFPIVGTTAAYPAKYGADLATGMLWRAPLEAVLGADVAAKTGLGVGDTFASTHGLSVAGQAHKGSGMRVAGTLAPTGTVIDRLVLTSLETVWATHGTHGDEIAGEAHVGESHVDEAHADEALSPPPPGELTKNCAVSLPARGSSGKYSGPCSTSPVTSIQFSR